MKITILGCMGGYPSNNQATSSYLVESGQFKLVVDFGSGAFQNLSKIVEPTIIDALLLTHYHHDHFSDTGVLQYAFQLKPTLEQTKKRELQIYGHSQSKEFEQLTMPTISKGIAYYPEETLYLGPFKINFLKTIHPVPTYDLRIEEKSSHKVFVFTADSGYLPDFIHFAENADLFIGDGMLLAGNENHQAHMTSQEIAKIANLANVKQIVITHLPPNNWTNLLEEAKQMTTIPITLAKDFDCYEL